MKPNLGRMRDRALVLIFVTYGSIAGACTTPATAPTPTLVPTPTPGSTINAEATVASVEKARSPIAISTRTPAVVAMVERRLEAVSYTHLTLPTSDLV